MASDILRYESLMIAFSELYDGVVIVYDTGVCKINGVVIVVNLFYSIGFSTTNNNKNTVYFANTGSVLKAL